MNDNEAAAIEAALDAQVSTREYYNAQRTAGIDRRDDYAAMDDAAAEIRVHAYDWLRMLLAERKQLKAVADAAQAWWTMPEDVSMDEVIMICDTLAEALAALDHADSE